MAPNGREQTIELFSRDVHDGLQPDIRALERVQACSVSLHRKAERPRHGIDVAVRTPQKVWIVREARHELPELVRVREDELEPRPGPTPKRLSSWRQGRLLARVARADPSFPQRGDERSEILVDFDRPAVDRDGSLGVRRHRIVERHHQVVPPACDITRTPDASDAWLTWRRLGMRSPRRLLTSHRPTAAPVIRRPGRSAVRQLLGSSPRSRPPAATSAPASPPCRAALA